jgi:hypothetical protein
MYLPGGPDPWLFLWSDDVYKFSDFVDQPDLEVASSMVVLPEVIAINDTVQIMVGVANRGVAETTAGVSVYINETNKADRIGFSYLTIPAGGTSGFTVMWDTTNMSGEQTIIVVAHAPNDPITSNDITEISAYIVKPGEKPLAEINIIDPNPVERDASNDVYFSGTGHSIGNITDYLWNVSGDYLANDEEFTVVSNTFDIGDARSQWLKSSRSPRIRRTSTRRYSSRVRAHPPPEGTSLGTIGGGPEVRSVQTTSSTRTPTRSARAHGRSISRSRTRTAGSLPSST